MSDFGQENPKTLEYPKERVKQVLKLIEIGVDTPDTVAIHATSVEALEVLLRKGSLPGHTEKPSERDELPQTGDIYFEPLPNFPFYRFPDLEEKRRSLNWYEERDEIMRGAGTIAERVAKAHAIQKLLGLPISEDEGHATSLAFEYPDVSIDTERALKFYGEMGIDEVRIKEVVEKVEDFGGLLLGLNKNSLNDYPITPGDAGSDIRLRTGGAGLSLKTLSGIRILGPESFAFVRSLNRS